MVENAKQYLKENPLVFLEIEQKVREKYNLVPGTGELPEEEAEKNPGEKKRQ